MLYDYIYISGFNLLISMGCAYLITLKKTRISVFNSKIIKIKQSTF